MNRRLTMCVTLAVLALIGAWSVHSVGQDLFDSSPGEDAISTDESLDGISLDDGDAASDDIFSAGSSDEPASEDIDDLFGPSEPGEGDLDLFDSSEDSDPVVHDDALDQPDFDLPASNDEPLDLGSDDAMLDDRGDAGVANPLNDPFGGGPTGLFGSPQFPNDAAAKQARQKLTRYQQSILAQYMQTKNKTTRDKLTQQLTKAVAQEFFARQQARLKELQALENELKRLRSIHQQREREKNTIVRNRVRQLIRDKEGLGWGSESVSRRFR